MISSPRKPDELDGPDAVHLILLDNGRTQAYADDQLRSTLQCIRCGACMNHCPVYTRVGGHAYGTTYPGPIGKIISPHLLGLDATYSLATASTLCGACAEVCPDEAPVRRILPWRWRSGMAGRQPTVTRNSTVCLPGARRVSVF
jgi:L-lactate dehydrogenase complex protein LldF